MNGNTTLSAARRHSGASILLLGCAFAAVLPAAPPPDDSAGVPLPSDEVLKMEAFQVSTSIGSYHEETSSMATKIPTDLKELSSSLQILNANAISDRNALTLQDVYQYVVGMTQTQNSANGFTFRGFPNTGTFTQNIEIDGLMGGTLKKGAVSAANVESVEFLKGPNSVLYGQMHPGGLLNIVTKSPKAESELNLRATVSTLAGQFDRFGGKTGYSGVIDATGPIGGSRHWLYRMTVDAENTVMFRPADYDRYLSVYPSLTYQWDPTTYITVKMESSQDKARRDDNLIPIFTQGIAYGPNARWTIAPYTTVYQDPTDVSRDHGAAISSEFHAVLDRWTLRAQTRSVWHSDYVREFASSNTAVFTPTSGFANPSTTLRRQYNLVINGHRYNFFDANVYGDVGPDQFKNTLLLGVGGGLEAYDNIRYGNGPVVTPAVTLVNPILGQTPYPADGVATQSMQNTLSSFGVYVSDQVKIGDRTHLTAGTRYDQQESHGIDAFNPVRTPYSHQFVTSFASQAGAVFDVTKSLSLYASWSQSIVPNNVTSLDSTGQSGFPPEKGLQYEGGLKFETPNRNLYASLAGYYIERTNVLVATNLLLPNGVGYFRLDGAQHSEGVEFETQWQPRPYWQVQAGVALSKAFVAASAKNPQTVGLDLTGAPRASGNFWTRYNLPGGPLKGLGIGVGVIYTGKYWGGDPTTAVYFPLPGWTRVDTALYYKWRRYSFALNIQNVLDRRYIAIQQAATFLIPGDERKLTLSAATHF